MVTVELDAATQAADGLLVTVTAPDANPPPTAKNFPRQPGTAAGTIEVDFPAGYPTGGQVTVSVAAQKSGVILATAAGTVDSLPAGCATLTIDFGRGDASADGKTGGTGGHGTGTGGTVGGAGGSGSGGKPGSGGSGSGGAAGSPVDAGPPLVDYTFDTTLQGFVLDDYVDPDTVNLFATYPGGTGTVKPSLTFDGTDGSPAAGSLKVTVTFTAYNQYVDVIIDPSPVLNLTGKTLHARLRLTSGAFAGGAQFHVSTGADFAVYVASPFPPPTPGVWVDGALDLSSVTAAEFDPTMVAQIGVQLFSGGGPDSGAYPDANMPVVFNIDTITD
jgi:hypothetical protein